jgi:hypothetical protein
MNRREFLSGGAVAAALSPSFLKSRALRRVHSQPDWVCAGDSWAQLSAVPLSHALGVSVLNVAVGGTTASWWLQRRPRVPDLVQVVRDSGAHAVYLSLGCLDMAIEGASTQRAARLCEALVMQLLLEGVSVWQAGYNRVDCDWIGLGQRLAALEFDEPLYHYVDFTHLERSVRLQSDGLHLTPGGYARRSHYVASRVKPEVQ